ncbi:MAG: hypothetical protein KIT49_00665 [Nitrospira sp.]|nr:hypothetical protein [Nitrospira sp.]
MYILGLATMGESAAALLKDGILIAAAEEERFTRIKHEGCFPLRAIAFCLAKAGISLAEIEHIGVYWQPFRMGTRARGMLKTALHNPASFLRQAGSALREFTPAGGGHSPPARAVGWNYFLCGLSCRNILAASVAACITSITTDAIWRAPSSPRPSKRRRSSSSTARVKRSPPHWPSEAAPA